MTATTASDLFAEDIENLRLNPKVLKNASFRPTAEAVTEKGKWKRNIHKAGSERNGDWRDCKETTLGLKGALEEAQRCLKCVDAPCQKSCPTSIDIKAFIGCIANHNNYGASKLILSDNPVGLSCGMICPTSNLCAGGCNLAASDAGAINISGLQEFAVNHFKKMNIRATRNPDLPPADQMPSNYKTKITCIGSGPASVCCATFLARLGYTNIHIVEKESYAGGLSSSEIPQYRLDTEAVQWEIGLMKDLGVNVHVSTPYPGFATKEKDEKVFIGCGLPSPKIDNAFEGLSTTNGFYTSKDFLPASAEHSKTGMCSCKSSKKPILDGRVLVLGAGDTAFDCTGSAFRCGAKRVMICFRRSTADMRACPEETILAKNERAEFLPYCQPKRVNVNKETGKISSIEMWKMEKNDDGSWARDDDQILTLKCDYIISAFGSALGDISEEIKSVADINSWGQVVVDPNTLQTKTSGVFAGGDCIGSGLTVEAANDGKTAAWGIHSSIQNLSEEEIKKPKLPAFHTEVDDVDISVDFVGLKFPNPFGLASAPPATTLGMIRRGFQQGWGFVVTKTFSLDKDFVTNISPRIVNGCTASAKYGPHQSSFLNIELISEKSAAYWCSGITQLKKDFPNHVVIASIMCGHNEADWKELAKQAIDCGSDALELNLSCPHGMGEKGMGLACGQKPHLVKDICGWVREVCPKSVPFFAKMTPNITDVCDIAGAAKEGGADGVTAINTVSGLQHIRPDASPWPAVGTPKRTTYGGCSGNAIRPIALKMVSSIGNKFPNYPVMATGGAENADTVLQFIYSGAPVVQVSSAIQNQDFTIVQDWISGLKWQLYALSRPDLEQWQKQVPPAALMTFQSDRRKEFPPRFGPHLVARHKRETIQIGEEKEEVHEDPVVVPKAGKIPKVNDLVGRALKHIGTFTELLGMAPHNQAVALVNDDLCINCGKCYMTCNDTGYQAINFSPDTHQPLITDTCTGCTLCVSVCPVPDCITMVPRNTESRVNNPQYNPSRGIPYGQKTLPVGASVVLDLEDL